MHCAIQSVDRDTSPELLNVKERVHRVLETLVSHVSTEFIHTFRVTDVLTHLENASIKENLVVRDSVTEVQRATENVNRDSSLDRVLSEQHSVTNQEIDIPELVSRHPWTVHQVR